MPLPSPSTTSTSPPCSPVTTTTTTTTTTTRRTNKKASSSLLFTLKPPVLLSAPVRSSRSTLFVSNKNSSSFSNSSSNKRNNNKKLPLEAIVLLFACASALVSFLILHSSAATAATTTTTTTSSTANHQPQQQQQQQLNGHVETSSFHHHYQNYNNNNNNNNNNIPVFPHSDNPYSAVSLLAQTLPANAVIHSIHGTNMSHHNNNNINNSSSLSYAGTIVSAYFRLKSKYSSETYEQKWMQHFLSLQDPMVIYTARSSSSSTTSSNTTISSSTTTHQQQQQQQQSPPDIVELIAQQRQHAPTVIIELQSLSDMPIAYLDYNNYNYNNNQNHSVSSNDNNNNNNKNNNTAFPFWEHQLQIDPERKRHQSYQLFWIWLSKTWFVQQAIQLNFFQSDFFVWSDIGCFRQQRNKQQYHGKLLLNDVAVIQQVMPDHQTLLWMAHHDTNPPPNGVWLWNNKYTQKQHFYHSGSQGAGYATAWTRFLPRLADTIDAFRTANNNSSSMFLGEDQCLLQATCLRFPDNCAYVPTKQVPDNHYFGLRHVLHHHHYKENQRGQQRPLPKYNLWRPPLTTTTFHKKNVSKTTAGV